MSFSHPLGFLCLLAIPVLVAVYIIKSHYTEQTVASTYLWELSEKFIKKRRRFSGITGIVALILEIFAVIAITFAVVGPVFTVPNSAGTYTFILDASGSMNMQKDGVSRMERGKAEIRDIIDESSNGSVYTLILMGSDTTVVYERLTDKSSALKRLDEVKCGWTSPSPADAIRLAQGYYNFDTSSITYFVTDKTYLAENIRLVDVSDHEENYALVSYEAAGTPTSLTVRGELMSYESDRELTVELYVDGVKYDEKKVDAKKQTPAEYALSAAPGYNYDELRVHIADTDGLMLDNDGIIYRAVRDEYNRALIVSDAPGYLQYAFKALGGVSHTTVDTREYASSPATYAGYGLYVFDTFANPQYPLTEVPKGASVWMFNPDRSFAQTGFSFQSRIEPGEADDYFEPVYTSSTSSAARSLTYGLTRQNIAVKKYSRCVINGDHTSVMSVGGDSLLFAGVNGNGDRQVTFAFDLHDSDMALKVDFIPLMRNLISYSFPKVLDGTVFTAGSIAEINNVAGCTNMVLVAPSGARTTPQAGSAVYEAALNEAGVYDLTVTVGGADRRYKLFSRVPEDESYPQTIDRISIKGESSGALKDGFYDGLIAYFILLALVFFADWGVYCYEQYQLR